MNYIENRITTDTDIKQLLKAYNSNKDYLIFDYSVFNAGYILKVVCSNNMNSYVDNGYDFILDNSYETNQLLEKIIIDKIKPIHAYFLRSKEKSFLKVLKQHLNISDYYAKQLMKIYKGFTNEL